MLIDYTTNVNLIVVWYFDPDRYNYIWASLQLIILLSSQILASNKMGNVDNIQSSAFYYEETTQSIGRFDRFITLLGFGRVRMGCKSIYNYEIFYPEYFNLKLYQLCFDGLPTMCLQLYIALASKTSSLTLIASITITFASILFSIFRLFHKNAKKHSFDKTISYKVDVNDCNIDNNNKHSDTHGRSNVIDAFSTLTMTYSRISQIIMCLLVLTDTYIRTFPFIFATFMIRTIVSNIGIHSFVDVKDTLPLFIVLVFLAFIWFIMIIITVVSQYIMLNWMAIKSKPNPQNNTTINIKSYCVFASCFSCLFNIIFVLPLKRFDQKYSFQTYVCIGF